MAESVVIIAATDFSAAADLATYRAASLASELGATFHLIHALPPEELIELVFKGEVQNEAERLRARAELALEERAQRISSRFSVDPVCHLVQGRAHRAILDAINSLKAILVVLGTQGEREGVIPAQSIGDTAWRVAGHSGAATLLVRREANEHYRHVLACAKGAAVDLAVVGWASRVSPSDVIHVVSAYEIPYERRLIEWGASQVTIDAYANRGREERTRYLSGVLSELGVPAARAQLHIERGGALQAILHKAREMEADLIVMGKQERPDALAEGPFGSVARHIAFLAPMDVMIVHP